MATIIVKIRNTLLNCIFVPMTDKHSTALHSTSSYLILPKRLHETFSYYLHLRGPPQAKEPGLLDSKVSTVLP